MSTSPQASRPSLAPARAREGRALLALAAVAWLLRLALMGASAGSNDLDTWWHFAGLLRAWSIGELYERVQLFNHPPLMGYWALTALRLTDGSFLQFGLAFRSLVLLSELGTAWLLWRIWRPRAGAQMAALAVCLFAWNPVSILLSAHHGNTDCLCAMFCLLAAYLVQERRAWLLAGLALAAALNVKLIPVFMGPALLAGARSRRDVLRFAMGMAIGLLPFAPVLLAHGAAFHRNAIAYNSNLEHWGIPYLLLLVGGATSAGELLQGYLLAGRHLILAGVAALGVAGWWSRRWSAYTLAALCLGLFLILAPGFGVQYVVYVVPLMFAAELARPAVYSAAAGLFLAATYLSFWDGEWPAQTIFTSRYPLGPSLLGLAAWTLLLLYFVRRLREPSQPPAALPAGSP